MTQAEVTGGSYFVSSNDEINIFKYERRLFRVLRNVYFLLNSKWRRRRSDNPEEGKLKVGKKFSSLLYLAVLSKWIS